jgi:hypothetical protein
MVSPDLSEGARNELLGAYGTLVSYRHRDVVADTRLRAGKVDAISLSAIKATAPDSVKDSPSDISAVATRNFSCPQVSCISRFDNSTVAHKHYFWQLNSCPAPP